MATLTYHVEINSHERKADYYKNDSCVASLNLQSDEFEAHEELTEDEADECYHAMLKEVESFTNEFNL